MKLSIAYITNRHEPHFEWFAGSLHRETGGNYAGIQIIVVDYWCQHEPERLSAYFVPRMQSPIQTPGCAIQVVPPHPNVWQGKYKLAAEDYFSASCARNTAICLAPDGYIAFVDDISVLMPGWLAQVREAMAGGWIACGAYRKVNNLVVHNGEVTSYMDHPAGMDCRWRGGIPLDPQPCGGGDMFGCSVAAPVDAFLRVNGFDEDIDSMGSEDYVCGIMLSYAGYHLKYCRRMVTWESEELHHAEKPFRRIIKKQVPGVSHFGEIDASHAILGLVRKGRRYAPNYFPEGGLRAERERVLRGDPFTVIQCPQHDWRDSRPIIGMGRHNDGCP